MLWCAHSAAASAADQAQVSRPPGSHEALTEPGGAYARARRAGSAPRQKRGGAGRLQLLLPTHAHARASDRRADYFFFLFCDVIRVTCCRAPAW